MSLDRPRARLTRYGAHHAAGQAPIREAAVLRDFGSPSGDRQRSTTMKKPRKAPPKPKPPRTRDREPQPATAPATPQAKSRRRITDLARDLGPTPKR
jgi:hypothetical protein